MYSKIYLSHLLEERRQSPVRVPERKVLSSWYLGEGEGICCEFLFEDADSFSWAEEKCLIPAEHHVSVGLELGGRVPQQVAAMRNGCLHHVSVGSALGVRIFQSVSAVLHGRQHHGSVGSELRRRMPQQVAIMNHGRQQESPVIANWPKMIWKVMGK
jgi:hypothetical protein